MESLVTVILAAGKGTRMKSGLVKVLHVIAGLPMLAYPVRVARETGCARTIIVTGHQKEKVEDLFKDRDITFAHQEKQLGSGHAVSVAEDSLKGFEGDVLILSGDVPLLTSGILIKFVKCHRDNRAVVSVLSVTLADPSGYGRVLRDDSGKFFGVVEQRDASEPQKAIKEINTGIYCCRSPFLFDALKKIGRDNKQGEYYLPDIVSVAVREGEMVQAVETDDFQQVKGINDRVDLAEAEKVMRRRILHGHMKNGVTIIDPDSTYIDADVEIGIDTVIYPNTVIREGSKIGSESVIDINCSVSNSVIGKGVHIQSSCVIEESRVEDKAVIGPFAHLRPLAVIGEEAKIGNFVEVKKSTIGRGSKVNHLTYIGDATIGSRVNIGAGTITCNYDGRKKHPTLINDGVFVGSNVSLVAPVNIGENASIGAGSTITNDVPANSLAVSRSKQRNYSNYSKADKNEER
jgi:bifunctional UDP-N-acetylglucosamine pyrophosphorylase/glucosamine-1-phosphate N-acetyltransferase